MAIPHGRTGSWFATWKGESLPCVHQHWAKGENGRFRYCDPFVNTNPKWSPFIEAIQRKKKVILTRDKVTERVHGREPDFEREEYIALYSVENVQNRDGVLSFEFVQRLEDF